MLKTIAILITCHNRRDMTIKCLEAIYIQEGLNYDFELVVFLVDDGSIDGTSKAVLDLFPLVNIIRGDGNLYWNRGMYLAWETAEKFKDFDYYLWLNDDTYLYKCAIKSLLHLCYSNDMVCGTTQSQINGKATYGGYISNGHQLILPNGYFQLCDYCNGNCVLIPKLIFNIIGKLDPIFTHAFGDFDYSLRVRQNGFKIYVSPKFVGLCEAHQSVNPWQSRSYNLLFRLKNLYSKSSGCNPYELFVFENRHFGLFLAITRFISIHFRVIFPY